MVSVVPSEWILGNHDSGEESLLAALGHFCEFAVFAALVAVAVGAGGSARGDRVRAAAAIAWGALAGIAFGLAIELVQWPIPYRTGSFVDWAVDWAGAVAGLAAFSALRASAGGRREPRA